MELKYSEKASIVYHNIFDYPLTKKDLKRWQCKEKIDVTKYTFQEKDGYLFIKGKEKTIKKRLKNEKESGKKLKIANQFVSVVSKIPFILFVGITGSLAMNNASRKSDIDILIITENNRLWLTRVLVYLLSKLNNLKIRSPQSKDEQDKLCLNMWLEENSLVWDKKQRNIYTAHEIKQIVPLLNRNQTFEKFVDKNSWVNVYWGSYKLAKEKTATLNVTSNTSDVGMNFLSQINNLLFLLQMTYMRGKVSNETVQQSKALFHPINWLQKIRVETQGTL